MKNPNNITTLLGVTQLELAILLRVSRSHVSMYELGRRDLPLHAKQTLAELLSHVQTRTAKAKPDAAHATETKRQLQLLLRDNEYKQIYFEKKRATASKKYESSLRAGRLLEVLNKRVSDGSHRKHLGSILVKANSQKGIEDLVKCQLELERLVAERQWLDGRLNQGSRSSK